MTNGNLSLLKLLADETRLDILNLLLAEDSHVEKLACELSLTPATICYHLKKLESAGVVTSRRSQFCVVYSVKPGIFDRPLSDFIKRESIVGAEEKYRLKVISDFFRFGKLTNLPAERKKRGIILSEIAKSFERGRDYSESEVDEIIHRFHDDHCLIRREMIAAGIMEREDGVYRLL